jgi:hypothetical protein
MPLLSTIHLAISSAPVVTESTWGASREINKRMHRHLLLPFGRVSATVVKDKIKPSGITELSARA